MMVRELERRPLRTALTTLGIASSVAIIVAGTWWGDAFDHLVDSELFRHGHQFGRAALLQVVEMHR